MKNEKVVVCLQSEVAGAIAKVLERVMAVAKENGSTELLEVTLTIAQMLTQELSASVNLCVVDESVLTGEEKKSVRENCDCGEYGQCGQCTSETPHRNLNPTLN
jgi:hypothetical protein